jgi:hypothetical protein
MQIETRDCFLPYSYFYLLQGRTAFVVLVLVGAAQWQHVGIVTRLRVGWVGVRIRAGAMFSAPAQKGPGVQPASCKWVPGHFPGGKAARAWR